MLFCFCSQTAAPKSDPSRNQGGQHYPNPYRGSLHEYLGYVHNIYILFKCWLIHLYIGMPPRDGGKMGGGYGHYGGGGGGGWSGGRGGMEMPNLQTLGLGGGAGGTGQGQGMNNPMGLGALNLGMHGQLLIFFIFFLFFYIIFPLAICSIS